jgi:hypothetical protein
MWQRVFAVGGIILVAGLSPSAATAQTTGGAVVGTARDESGAAMPGVVVEAESPALIERVKTDLTNSSGQYQIVDLRVGTYAVTFALDGFRTVRREGIQITDGFTATVNVVLQVGSRDETITVVGEAPVIDVRSNVSETALSQELKEGIPTARNIYQVGLFMPGATTTSPDVGGSQSGQITNLSIHGSQSGDITFNADGLDITGIQGSGGVTALYYNEGFNEEVSVKTKALPAEVASGGVSLNMIKKQGSNEFHGDAHLSYTGDSLQSDNVSQEQRDRGLEAPDAMDKAYDINANLGGPFIRDRLWFAAGYRRWRVDRLVANTFDLDGSQSIDDQLITNYDLSMTWQINARNRLTGFYEYSNKLRSRRRVLSSSYQFITPEASSRAPNLGPMGNLKWTSTVRPNFLFEGGLSYIGWAFKEQYQEDAAADGLPRNDLTRSTLTGATLNDLVREPTRVTGTFIATWMPSWKGTHQLRFGGQYTTFTVPDSRTTLNGWDLVARYRNGVPDSVQVFNTPVATQVTVRDYAFFAQDSWTMKRFTINAGLRMDVFKGRVDEQEAAAGSFVPARRFDAIDDVPNWTDIVPRLAFVYDLSGNGKTALKWNVSKYTRKEGAALPNLVNPMRFNTEVRSWTDRNGDLVPQRDEIGAGRGALDRGATVRQDPDLERPYQWEYTVSLEHELMKNLGVTLSYFRRNYRSLYSTVNAALSPSDYLPVTIQNPLTGEPLTVYNQNPATSGRVDNVLRNSDALDSTYNGFEIAFHRRMANNFAAFGGFTISSNKDCANGAASTNPNDAINACGYSQFDSKYLLNVSAIYRFPGDINASTHLQYASGKPQARDFVVTRTEVPGLTQVTQRVTLVPAGDLRYPSWTLLDFRISRPFRRGRVTIEPMLDLYNALNESATLSQVITVGPALGEVSENVDGRLLRIGARIRF